MSELSPEARRLLLQLDASDATAADEARVRAALERSLGVTLTAAAVVAAAPVAASAVASAQAVTAQASAAAGAGAAAATSTSLVTASLAGVLAVALGAGATVAVIAATRGTSAVEPHAAIVAPVAPTPREAPPPPAVEAPPAVAPAPADDLAFGVDLSAEPSTTPAPSGPPAPPRAKTRQPVIAPLDPVETRPEAAEPQAAAPALAAPHVPASCDRTTELSYLEGAEAALSGHQATLALAWLDAFYSACPTGVWDPRAWVTRTSAMCASGQLSQATALIEWYVAEYPQGADLARVEPWCPRSVFPQPR